MTIVIDILLAVLIASVSALCIYLLFWLKSVGQNISNMERDINSFVDSMLPLIENLNETSNKVGNIVSVAESQVSELSQTINRTKARFNSIFSSLIKENEENQMLNFITNLRAFAKGVSTFFQAFTKKNSE